MENSPRLRGQSHASGMRHEPSRHTLRDPDRDGRSIRHTTHRTRNDSSDRVNIRNFPQGTSRAVSPARGTRSIMSRDYGDPHRALSPTDSRARNAEFNFGPARLRRRLGSTTTSVNPSPGVAQSWADFGTSGRRSVAIAPTVSGRDMDESRTFSLAGPAPIDTLVANQPYVDPGYAQLNPAYDQPTNVRPVWGFAKPLPRVLRPGMVPSQDEVEQELEEEAQQQEQTGELLDLESGRIEPSLRLDISSQLDTIRRERELSLFRSYRSGHQYRDSPAFSPYGAGRRSSDPALDIPHHDLAEETIEEEQSSTPRQRPEDESDLDAEEFPQLSESIANLNQAKEEETLHVPYQDAVPLPAYQAEDDEVHNLHTYWSIIRLRFREPLAEFLAVLVMDVFGFSCNLMMTVSSGRSGTHDMANWAWGIAVMMAIYIAGGVSGAQLNPAVSIMLYVYRGFPLHKIPIFAIAQCLGAFVATLITYGIFQPGLMALLQEHQALQVQGHDIAPSASLIKSTVLINFIGFPRAPWVDFRTAYLTEFTGAACMAVTVLALGDDTNAPPGAGMGAFIVGLLVVLLGFAFGGVTGIMLNPVRDFGPRLALTALGYGKEESLFADGYWFKVVWLGALSGVMLGGFLYDAAIFIGGESPVNYPTKRIKRAARKWRKRWRARMRMTKKMAKNVKKTVGSGYEPVEG